MRTQTLVQASADIVTITTLRQGDVYKRLEVNASGYGEKYVLNFGVVTDVLHNGEDSVISALEFEVSWTGVTPKLKTFGTDSDLKLFDATPEEVRQHFGEVRDSTAKAVRAAEDALAKAVGVDQQVRAVTGQLSALALTAPVTHGPLEAGEEPVSAVDAVAAEPDDPDTPEDPEEVAPF